MTRIRLLHTGKMTAPAQTESPQGKDRQNSSLQGTALTQHTVNESNSGSECCLVIQLHVTRGPEVIPREVEAWSTRSCVGEGVVLRWCVVVRGVVWRGV